VWGTEEGEKLRQVFAPYYEWEDFLNGMYDSHSRKDERELIAMAKGLLCDDGGFYSTCRRVVSFWKVATAVNLTNVSCNRRAWLGQASCNLEFGVPEILTRVAWNSMTEKDQLSANGVADRCIKEYLSMLVNGKNVDTGTGFQTKLQLG